MFQWFQVKWLSKKKKKKKKKNQEWIQFAAVTLAISWLLTGLNQLSA